MDKVVKDALKAIERYELLLFDFVEACDNVRDLQLTEQQEEALVKAYRAECAIEIPESAELYGRNYQDADYRIGEIFKD